MKILIAIFVFCLLCFGGYYFYHHEYVETLMLSEIVTDTEDNWTKIAVGFLDFDTGLTRHDLNQLYSKKDYWLKRINDVDKIIEPNLKAKESEKLLAEMMDDQAIKKVLKGSFTQTSEFIKEILK
jgi:hypothetical protein